MPGLKRLIQCCPVTNNLVLLNIEDSIRIRFFYLVLHNMLFLVFMATNAVSLCLSDGVILF